jgi:hypothetical protein
MFKIVKISIGRSTTVNMRFRIQFTLKINVKI